MPRIMALDVGAKTIGVAFTDETETYVFPGATIWRQEGKKRDMAALRQLIQEQDVKQIVVGMPLMPDGTQGVQAEKIAQFIATLRNHVRIPITTEDERLTTFEAEELLRAAGRRREEQKRTLDSVAAALILQSYLSRRQRAVPEPTDETER